MDGFEIAQEGEHAAATPTAERFWLGKLGRRLSKLT